MGEPAVEFRGYTKKMQGKVVLENLALSLEKGQITGFCGPNGSGKTMLLRAVAGLILPTKGSVSVFGEILNRKKRYPESMGLVIEKAGFWDYQTGFANLRELARIRNRAKEGDIRAAMTRVGLEPDDRRPVRKYSLGMKQRLALAQALMEKPALLLFDEPTSALDRDGVQLFAQILQEEKGRGATVLLASHVEQDLEACDALYQINQGRCERSGGEP